MNPYAWAHAGAMVRCINDTSDSGCWSRRVERLKGSRSIKLSNRQWEALSAVYDARPASADTFKAQGIRLQTVWLLERKGLLVRWDYANGPHWDLSNEAHELMRMAFNS